MRGKVYLVGAGPGDPELITVKGLHCIRKADVICYDRLVNPTLLEEASRHVLKIYCGKRPGAPHMNQQEITNLLVQYALEGKVVVRLKGGDPFVFGRGGEELLALAEAGLECEVVPGVTAALGISASSEIPLTHRLVSGSFACVTGHRCDSGAEEIKWGQLANSVDTLVIYMGVAQAAHIQQELLQAGKHPETPIAVIEQGTTEHQKIWRTDLWNLQRLLLRQQVQNPALMIIGDVVRVKHQLDAIRSQSLLAAASMPR